MHTGIVCVWSRQHVVCIVQWHASSRWSNAHPHCRDERRQDTDVLVRLEYVRASRHHWSRIFVSLFALRNSRRSLEISI